MILKGHGLEGDFTYSPPDFEDWMRVTVRIIVPDFEGSFSCTIQTAEHREFIAILEKLKDSIGTELELTWGNMEENVSFMFSLEPLGKINVTYSFSGNNFSLGPTLTGEFESDQSFLDGWIRQARSVVIDAS